MKYFAARNEEGPYSVGPHETEADAIEEAKIELAEDLEDGGRIVIGISREVPVRVCGESLIETIGEQMYDELYEDALDGWCAKISKEAYEDLDQQLTDVVTKWLEKNNQQSSFDVIDSYKDYQIPNQERESE